LTFGEQLRLERARHRLSQQQLGEAIGLSQTHISALERGEYPPTKKIINRLSEYFGTPEEFWHFYNDVEMVLNATEIEIIALLRDDRIDEVIELLQSFNELFASMGQG